VRVVVASGVLQYVEDLHGALEALTRTGAEHFIIDRTPMSAASAHRLCIQHVPKHIYAASYPCRVLSKVCLVDQLERHWTVRCDFACAEGDRQTDDGLKFAFRGLILQRRTLL